MQGAKDFRLGIALVTLVITLGMCLGGYYGYQEFGVKRPLNKALLGIDGVSDVKIKNEANMKVVTVSLKEGSNLLDAYQKAEELSNAKLGESKYRIEIVDNSTQELESVFRRISPGIHEGIAKDSYLWLAGWIEENAQNNGCKSELQVDDGNVYVTISKGNDYIYRILTRNAPLPSNEGVS